MSAAFETGAAGASGRRGTGFARPLASSPFPRAAREKVEAAQPLVSSIQTVAVKFDCRKGSQTGPCSLVAAGVFEPVPEYRTHGHRAGLH